MSYINLIEKISYLDKQRLDNYINKYGVVIKDFIGLNKWLSNWDHSNQKLYKFLGNQLIKEVPFEYKKTKNELIEDIKRRMMSLPFKENYYNFIFKIIRKRQIELNISNTDRLFFYNVIDYDSFVDNAIAFGIKYKRPDKDKILQIQPKTKPLKALYRIMEYFKDLYPFSLEYFEDFKATYSIILNDINIKEGTMCFSIHPLDFLTMSDNSLDWTSCMSWTDDGCYHQGTVEMMNSNNVICCYLKGNKPFNFGKKEHINDPAYAWNNKKWRILAYVTKDIIMTGKSYPYKNDDFCKSILLSLQELAKQNMNWTYSFGPELYKDMIHINNNNQMMRNRNWISTKTTTKHNILFDTKGMYNDMLNDHKTNYWCIRNKVDHNKIISISGKSVCLCCGKPVIKIIDHEWEDDYNDRYNFVGNVVCSECLDKNFTCDRCNSNDPTQKYFNIRLDNDKFDTRICEPCYRSKVRLCPCCGKPFFISNNSIIGYVNLIKQYNDSIGNGSNLEYYDVIDERDLEIDILKEIITYEKNHLLLKERKCPVLEAIYVCKDCTQNFIASHEFKKVTTRRYHWNERSFILFSNKDESIYKYIISSLSRPKDFVYQLNSSLKVGEIFNIFYKIENERKNT